MTEHTKHWIDWAAVVGAVTTFIGWLPDVAAFLSVVWLCLSIYAWFEKRLDARRNRKP